LPQPKPLYSSSDDCYRTLLSPERTVSEGCTVSCGSKA
jgi:hypothetical protein